MHNVDTTEEPITLYTTSKDVTRFVDIQKNLEDNVSIIFCLHDAVRVTETSLGLLIYCRRKINEPPQVLYRVNESQKIQLEVLLTKYTRLDGSNGYRIDKLCGNISYITSGSVVYAFPP